MSKEKCITMHYIAYFYLHDGLDLDETISVKNAKKRLAFRKMIAKTVHIQTDKTHFQIV